MRKIRNFKFQFNTVLLFLLAETVLAQERVTRTVTDLKNGKSSQGVNVFIKGTTIGSITDIAGNYSIEVRDENKTYSETSLQNGFLQSSNHIIGNSKLGVEVDQLGQIVRFTDYSTNQSFNGTGSLQIEGMFAKKVDIEKTQPYGLKIYYQMADSMGDRSCTIVKTIVPTTNSIRVNFKVLGDDYDWTSAINTKFSFPTEINAMFWTAWGLGDDAESSHNIDGDLVQQKGKTHQLPWHDPLRPQAFQDMQLWYGGKGSEARFRKGFSLPIGVVIFPKQKRSLNIVLNPKDTIINLSLKTSSQGDVIFSRENHRIGAKKVVSFSYDLFIEEADWRPALGWITNTYPEFFKPTLDRVHEVAGPSSYSGYNGNLDVEKMKYISYGFNWYASRSWPYLGMFLPPVEDGQSWMSWAGFGSGTATTGKITSFETINKDYKLMHERGFHMLAYFNLNEFGYRIKFPFEEISKDINEADWWKNSNLFLQKKLKSAMLFTEDNGARFSWNKSVVMDPGHEVYKEYLLEQAQRYVDKIPDFDGICIDRLDWFEWFNYRRDDGVSMVDGKKVSAMALSLHQIMEPLSKLLHEHNKVLFYNPHLTRLDFAQYFDGIFDEFTDSGDKINLSSLLALKKPIIGWIHNEDILREAPDYLMQKYLYLGVYPMAPYPEANHSLVASEWADSLFADYGLMIQELKGKEWVFNANIVGIENNAAKVNIFKTHEGVIIPIMLGNKDELVSLKLKSIVEYFPKGKCLAYLAHPGDEKWEKIKFNLKKEEQTITVRLKRGCAMLLFK